MNLRSFCNRLKGRSPQEEANFDEEVAFHAEMKARELQAGGLSEEAARVQALRSLGNLTLAREDVRAAWSLVWITDAVQDLKYAARGLAAQPGFTLAAVLALVLGIGVNAVLFNVYNALALAPYALRDARDTVQVWGEGRKSWQGFSWSEYRYLREHARTLSGLLATTNTVVRMAPRPGAPAWTGEVAAVSENYFEVAGARFVHGRGFSPEAGRVRDPAPEIVLHYDTWVSRFGSDPNIVGGWIEVSGHQLRVTGIAAAGFAGASPVRPHAWIPGPWRDIFEPGSNTYSSPNSCCVLAIGRVNKGVSRAEVQAELEGLRAQYQAQSGREGRRVRLTTPSVLSNPKAESQALPLFFALGVAAALILLLACANVANLQISRALTRRREISVRLALGAGRGRVLRQMLAESLLLASIAGGASAAIASWAPARIVAFIAAEERVALRFDNDFRVLAFIAAVTLLAALISGFAPAWGAVREALAEGLREGGRCATSRGRLRRILLAGQVALSAVLVSGTALLVRVAEHARGLDPGFASEDVIVMQPGLDSSGATDELARSLLAALVDRLQELPGVESVAHSVAVPLGNTNMGWRIRDGRGGEVAIGFDRVSANFHETLRIPILAGARFTKDAEARGGVAIVTQAAAERLWPGGNPVGKPVGPDSETVVAGVAANIAARQFGTEGNPHMWLAAPAARDSRLLIRHAPGAGEALMAALPRLAREQDSRFMAVVAPYSETLANARRGINLAAAVAGVLGGLALLLACIGIYSVAAYHGSQRTREIGVRMALGAQPSRVLAMILRQNLGTVAAGTAAGMVGAMAFARLLKTMLYGLAPEDPAAIGATLAILAGTALLATWTPARRAAGIDPSITLRQD